MNDNVLRFPIVSFIDHLVRFETMHSNIFCLKMLRKFNQFDADRFTAILSRYIRSLIVGYRGVLEVPGSPFV